MESDDRVRELEDQHFFAGFDLERAALTYFFDNRASIAAKAVGGSESAATLVDAIGHYFRTLSALDAAEIAKVDSQYR